MTRIVHTALTAAGLILWIGEAIALEYVYDCPGIRSQLRQASYDLVQAERTSSPQVDTIRRRLVELSTIYDRNCLGAQSKNTPVACQLCRDAEPAVVSCTDCAPPIRCVRQACSGSVNALREGKIV